jgi:hypothetical protein
MTARTTARFASLSAAFAMTFAMLLGTGGLAHASARTAALVGAQAAASHA